MSNTTVKYSIEIIKKCGLYEVEVYFRSKTRLGSDHFIYIGADVNTHDINISATGPLPADDNEIMEGFLKAVNIARDIAIGNVHLID